MAATPAERPWYTYPRIDNFGVYPDPVGLYPKPDSNIDVPAGVPITALASGVVTGARAQPWGPEAYSITVKLDKPLNAVATHMAYNYVGRPHVSVGQRVAVGDTLAIAGNPYGIGTAFALCDADVYGTGTKNEPFRGTYINPLLNPVPFLDSIQKNGPPASGSPGGQPGPGGQPNAPTVTVADNPMARLANTVLTEIGVPGPAVAALNGNGAAMTYIGAGITSGALLAAAGVLFLFTGV